MAGVNKVILLGNLGIDPEVKHFEGGAVVARVSLATSKAYKDKEGNRVEQTEWHDVEMWDKLATLAEQYLRSGDTIYVEGELRSNTWQDDQGKTRKTIRIRATTVNIIKTKAFAEAQANGTPDSRPALQQQQRPAAVVQESAPDPLGHSEGFDDLPF